MSPRVGGAAETVETCDVLKSVGEGADADGAKTGRGAGFEVDGVDVEMRRAILQRTRHRRGSRKVGLTLEPVRQIAEKQTEIGDDACDASTD